MYAAMIQSKRILLLKAESTKLPQPQPDLCKRTCSSLSGNQYKHGVVFVFLNRLSSKLPAFFWSSSSSSTSAAGFSSTTLEKRDKNRILSRRIVASFNRLRVVPYFPSGMVERTKRERPWKSPHARKADYHARSSFARSTIPQDKWGLLVVKSFNHLTNEPVRLHN